MTTTNESIRQGNHILYEILVLWPAWQTFADHYGYPGETPGKTDPKLVWERFRTSEDVEALPRLAALLYAKCHADTPDEGLDIATQLIVMAQDGRRPRFGREAGIGPLGDELTESSPTGSEMGGPDVVVEMEAEFKGSPREVRRAVRDFQRDFQETAEELRERLSAGKTRAMVEQERADTDPTDHLYSGTD